jgi:hypothetical protein
MNGPCPVCVLVKLSRIDPEGAVSAAIGFGVICARTVGGGRPGHPAALHEPLRNAQARGDCEAHSRGDAGVMSAAPLWLVVKEPGKPARALYVSLDAALDEMIGPGVLVDTFRFDSSGIHAYCDDDGLAKGLPHNFHRGGNPIVGSVVFSQTDSAGEEDVGFESEEEARAFALDLNGHVMPGVEPHCECGWPRPLIALTDTTGERVPDSIVPIYACPECGSAYAPIEIPKEVAARIVGEIVATLAKARGT